MAMFIVDISDQGKNLVSQIWLILFDPMLKGTGRLIYSHSLFQVQLMLWFNRLKWFHPLSCADAATSVLCPHHACFFIWLFSNEWWFFSSIYCRLLIVLGPTAYTGSQFWSLVLFIRCSKPPPLFKTDSPFIRTTLWSSCCFQLYIAGGLRGHHGGSRMDPRYGLQISCKGFLLAVSVQCAIRQGQVMTAKLCTYFSLTFLETRLLRMTPWLSRPVALTVYLLTCSTGLPCKIWARQILIMLM